MKTEQQFHIQSQESKASDISQSLTGNFTINSNNASQTFNVVADQLTEGTQTFKLKLNNNLAEVSVVVQDTSKTQPTPTPKPPSECCPSNTTSYNTNGEFEETQIKITLPGDNLSTTVAEYKGWANGGKLCIDMTDMGNSQDNSQTNTERYSHGYIRCICQVEVFQRELSQDNTIMEKILFIMLLLMDRAIQETMMMVGLIQIILLY